MGIIHLSSSMEVELSLFIFIFILTARAVHVEGYWCVARSDADDNTLLAALDYACSAGADCVPIQSSGLCYLPNTLQAHASYAFNSFYQRKNMAAGSCDFGGIATLAKTDPSYGSCVYPPNPRTAGLMTSPATSTTTSPTPAANPHGSVTPTTTTSTSTTNGGAGLTPTTDPTIPTTTSKAAPSLQLPAATFISLIALLLAA